MQNGEGTLGVQRRGERGEVMGVTLNRPEALNALDWATLEGLGRALDTAERDPDVRCLVVEGAGTRAFSAGADLRTVAGLTPESAAEWIRVGHHLFNRLVRSRVPSIAAIRGYVLGGGLELALACDLRVATEGARVGLPEVSRGWLPGWGGVQRMRAIAGPARARQVALVGQPLAADEALSSGLVHRVVADDSLAATARSRRRQAGKPEWDTEHGTGRSASGDE